MYVFLPVSASCHARLAASRGPRVRLSIIQALLPYVPSGRLAILSVCLRVHRGSTEGPPGSTVALGCPSALVLMHRSWDRFMVH